MVKDYKDYLSQLHTMYPDLTEETIEQTIKKGLSGLQDMIRRDHDVRLENCSGTFDRYRLIFYRSQMSEETKKSRFFKNLIRIQKHRDEKKLKYAEKLQSK